MGVDAPDGDVDDLGEKAGIKKGAEDHPRHSLYAHAHRAARKGRAIPKAGNSRRLSGRVVRGRD